MKLNVFLIDAIMEQGYFYQACYPISADLTDKVLSESSKPDNV